MSSFYLAMFLLPLAIIALSFWLSYRMRFE